MRELKEYLDGLLGKAGGQFLKREDAIFNGLFLILAGVLFYESMKWLYQFMTFPRLLLVSFLIFLGFTLRKYYGATTKRSLLVDRLEKNQNQIVYVAFIVFFLVLLTNFLILGENGLKYIVYGVLAIYVYFKFMGFKITYDTKRIDLKSENSLYLLVSGWAFLYMVLHYTFQEFDAGSYKALIYLGTGIIYFLGYMFLFTNSSGQRLRRRGSSPIQNLQLFALKNMYLVLSICCIGVLLGVIFFRGDNTIPQEIETKSEFQEKVEALKEQAENKAIEETPEEYRVAIKKVSELYVFSNRLELGSEGDEVQKLQGFLASKGNYDAALDGIFDEETRVALINTLVAECQWPETTLGILGPQAQDCINNMEVEHKVIVNKTVETEEIAEVQETEEVVDNTPEPETTEIVVEEPTIEIVEEVIEESIILEEPTEASAVVSSRFSEELSLGDSGAKVTELQNILIKLGYLGSDPDGNFDFTTSLALKGALIGQCGFSDDIEGNFDASAMACINSLDTE